MYIIFSLTSLNCSYMTNLRKFPIFYSNAVIILPQFALVWHGQLSERRRIRTVLALLELRSFPFLYLWLLYLQCNVRFC